MQGKRGRSAWCEKGRRARKRNGGRGDERGLREKKELRELRKIVKVREI